MNFEKKFDSTILKIIISTRKDGDMSMSSGRSVVENFLIQNQINPYFSDMTQDHGVMISHSGIDGTVPGDGLWTQDRNLCLAVRTADCLPVILFEPSKRFLIVLHCGFKGLRDGIIDESFALLKENGVDISMLFAFLGPGICSDCYIVDEERYKDFTKTYPDAAALNGGEFHIDLRKAIVGKLNAIGIVASNVQQLERCTKESEEFFSYRKGDKKERFVTIAQIDYV